MITKNLAYILIILGLIGALLPIFKAWTGIALYYPSFALLSFLYLFRNSNFFNNRTIIFLLIFLIYIFTFHFNLFTLPFLIRYFFPFFFITATLFYLINSKKVKILKWIAIISFSILVFRAITGIIVEALFPMSARMFTANDDIEQYDYLAKLGLGTYGYATGLIFVYPLLISLIKTNIPHKFKILIISFFILSITFLIETAFATALIFSILSLLGALLFSKNFKRNIFLVVFLLISLFIINTDVLTDKLLEFSKEAFVDNKVLTTKVNEIEESITYGVPTGDVDTRSNLYQKSWNAFITEPIIGTGSETTIGGHATWLDLLGMIGIAGTILIALIMFSVYNDVKKLIPRKHHFYFSFAFLIYIPLGLLKNCSGPEIIYMLFIVAPSLVFLNTNAYVDKNS